MFFLFKMALKNVFRNPRRSILTSVSVTFAVAIVIFTWSFIEGEIKGVFDVFISLQSGHVRVMNADFARREKMLPLQYSINGYQAVQRQVEAVPGVKVATGRIKFGVLLDYEGNTKQTLGIGIDPGREEAILGLSKKIVQGRVIGPATDEVNIGVNLARDLKLKLGDILTVVTQTAYGSLGAKNYKVVGIYDFDSPQVDRRMFFVPLSSAQDLLDLAGSATEIFVMTDDPDDARRMAGKISSALGGRYSVKAWQDHGAIYFFLTLFKYLYMIIYLMIVLLSAFTILNTMYMTVLERTREIGMMKALGMRGRQLIGLILLEALVLGVLASFVGAAIGAGLSYYFMVYGLDMSRTVENMEFPTPNVYYGVFSWNYVLTGFLVGIFCATIAAVFPALRAAKMEPTEALHEI
jgi:putative ABC transport system permease protein